MGCFCNFPSKEAAVAAAFGGGGSLGAAFRGRVTFSGGRHRSWQTNRQCQGRGGYLDAVLQAELLHGALVTLVIHHQASPEGHLRPRSARRQQGRGRRDGPSRFVGPGRTLWLKFILGPGSHARFKTARGPPPTQDSEGAPGTPKWAIRRRFPEISRALCRNPLRPTEPMPPGAPPTRPTPPPPGGGGGRWGVHQRRAGPGPDWRRRALRQGRGLRRREGD